MCATMLHMLYPYKRRTALDGVIPARVDFVSFGVMPGAH